MGQRAGGLRIGRLLVSDPTTSSVSKIAAAGRPFASESTAGAKTQTDALNKTDRERQNQHGGGVTEGGIGACGPCRRSIRLRRAAADMAAQRI